MSTATLKPIRAISFSFLLLLAFGFALAPTFAQSFRGSIRGTITDSSGGAVPATKVVGKNLATGETREVLTSGDGGYILAELQPGEYELSFEKAGFQRNTVRTRVSTGADTIVDFALNLTGAETMEVHVHDTAPLIESSTTTLSQVVDRTLVQELPLNGRDFTKLVALTPGVTVEGSGRRRHGKRFWPIQHQRQSRSLQ